MPKQVIAYKCDFDCGRRALISKSGMKAHETICFSNPANRACQTCEHDLGHYWSSEQKKHITQCSEEGVIEVTSECSSWELKDSLKEDQEGGAA